MSFGICETWCINALYDKLSNVLRNSRNKTNMQQYINMILSSIANWTRDALWRLQMYTEELSITRREIVECFHFF